MVYPWIDGWRRKMNPFLNDIYTQPSELKKVLSSLISEYQDQVYNIAHMLKTASEIVLTSMGSAYYSLMPMYYYLLRKGYRVSLVETSELLHSPEPVSYTHLDVYKRQLPDSSQRDRADTGDRDVVKTAYLYLGRHLPAMNGQSPKSP